ncbi:hypothetical protein JTB14_032929 [Gonioctena quinquepunctata]|nr:hypothetical protein JTB14_032929 [Gonioctena quinquepunctata]
MNNTTVYTQRADTSQNPLSKMEVASRNVDKSLQLDNNAPRLIDLMNINPQSGSTASGLIDHDYPSFAGLPLTLSNMTQIKCINNVPLPTEIVDHFTRILFFIIISI